MAKVAINGFGRIGRAAFKLLMNTPGLDLVAINDLVPPENLAYLLQYDTVYGRYPQKIQAEDHQLSINRKSYPVFNEKDPALLPQVIALLPDVLVVTADHSTPALMGSHSWHPVPVLLHSKFARAGGVDRFDEYACLRGSLGIRPALHLMG